MTIEEAQKVGGILVTADSGCPCCIEELVKLANYAFPEFIWKYDVETEKVIVTGAEEEGEEDVEDSPTTGAYLHDLNEEVE